MESRGPVTGRYCRLCGSGRTVGQQYRNRYPFQSGCSEGLSGQQSPVAESLPVVFYSGVQPVIAGGTAPGKRHRSGENRERTQERYDPGDHRNGRNASYRGNSREDFAGEQSEAQSAKTGEPELCSHELPGLLCRGCAGSGTGVPAGEYRGRTTGLPGRKSGDRSRCGIVSWILLSGRLFK